ncbi:MAG: Wzz/FepE/Etk N-terminal domain-containing protein, partial [Synergistales bacterium]|nr:Wzz/FepE/Etk N-terminal domain-containing protein [Synergistales bacterium]
MTEKQHEEANQQRETFAACPEDDEISLLDLMLVLARHKKLIFRITAAFAIAAIILSLVMTKQYKATARILNPVEQSAMATLLTQQLGGGVAELIKPEIKGNIYVGMLKSRTLQDWVLDRFGPPDWRDITGYGKENLRKDIVKEYIGEADAVEDKDGTISMSVVFTDPVKAAEIANAHVEGLKWMADTFAVTGASQRRLYLEKELEKARASLNRAEADFQKYQQETGVYMGEAQLTANIQNRINLRAQVAAREIQLNSLLAYATPQNPEAIKLRNQIDALKTETQRLEEQPDPGDPLNPEGGMPAARFEYLEKYREWKFQEVL